ncbi:MAG TPA: gluconate 2-dehydrogenase subunit 3 family protein [Devosiaceae bacterium]|jgi:gluconate 2-dehydrogenase gamma chain|nr:gluconate 2-dehydrogenase subunit 3 family protein [Devosiaceae bacterium]
MTKGLSRRDLFKTAGVAGIAAVVPPALGQQPEILAPPEANDAPAHQPDNLAAADVLFFFNDEEARFIEAVVERLIPADPRWPGAAEAGVLYYIDHQLASAYGAGGRMYLRGPWVPDAAPEQGYQLRFSPAELYRIGIEEARAQIRDTTGSEFWDLTPAAMDSALKDLETGRTQLPSLPAAVFFETLLANTIEGFFGDPAYGGNRDMVGWRMVGFPGAYAAYLEEVDIYNLEYLREPVGMANQQARLEHIHDHH